jgi:ABC-2 type transport system ATP-binding protein
MSGPVLSVRGLRKTYRRGMKKVEAVKGISFDIQPGTVTGFLGANGAGKTTSIKCILNLAFADAGEIHYFGRPELTSEAKQKIGFLPERPYFYEYLTGAEFLRFYGELSTRLKRKDLNERIEKLLKRVGLGHAKDRQLRSYSKGMLQRVGIAQTLIHEPEFIILDEPKTGLDPDGRYEVAEIIRETAKSGTAVFFSSHLLPDAELLCDRLVILKLGQLIYQGTTDAFLNQAESGVSIVARKPGGITETRTVPDHAAAQAAIDEIRRSGKEIMEVKTERLSLEEAFVRVAFDKKEAAP